MNPPHAPVTQRRTLPQQPAFWRLALAGAAALATGCSTPPPVPRATATVAHDAAHDAALAQRLGADAYGMRAYVLVVLKTGPNPMPPGPDRDAMFKGHFANMQRLADEGKLVLAGPFDGVDGWRGLFVYAVKTVDEARALAETDPVLQRGEMVAEYHRYYGTAALMEVNAIHQRIARRQP